MEPGVLQVVRMGRAGAGRAMVSGGIAEFLDGSLGHHCRQRAAVPEAGPRAERNAPAL